jgi:branched-chain amino acid transport system substrate-binding protein
MYFSKRQALKALALAAVSASLVGVASAQSPAPAPVRIALIEALSGAFANTGEAVFRNIVWAIERVNARGGVRLANGSQRLLTLERYDNKGLAEEALSALRAALDDGAQIILQGNSSAVAAALIDAINKHNEREKTKRVVLLNYSAVDPILTNEKCSPWHFRFDAHADMRMSALFEVLKAERDVKSVYLLGQDYSFGQAVLREARKQLAAKRADIKTVGDELHPLGRIKDFLPYASKIKASGADAVITGNWGNDLTLLVKACKEVGFEGRFYTFYGNALGAPAAIGDAGIGKVYAVADWLPNVPTAESEAFYKSFRARYPKSQDDYVHMRMHLMIELLANALQGAPARDQTLEMIALRDRIAAGSSTLAGQSLRMRAADGQAQQQLVVGVMDRQGSPGVSFDVEGSGYGFRVVRQITATQAEVAHTCQMPRPL